MRNSAEFLGNGEIPEEDKEYIEGAVDQLIRHYLGTRKAALRIGTNLRDRGYNPDRFEDLVRLFSQIWPAAGNPVFFDCVADLLKISVTDQPEKIPYDQKYVHLGPSTLVTSLIESRDVIAPQCHRNLEVKTERGEAINLLAKMLKFFGIRIGALEAFVYCGRKVDPRLLELINNNQGQFDIYQLLFADGGLAPLFKEVLDNLERFYQEQGPRPATDYEMTAKAIEFCQEMTKITYVRGVWWQELRDTLLGNREYLGMTDGLVDYWTDQKELYLPNSTAAARAVVLVINTERAIEDNTYEGLFLLSSRPIPEMLVVPKITRKAVEKIFCHPADLAKIKQQVETANWPVEVEAYGEQGNELTNLEESACLGAYRSGDVRHSLWDEEVACRLTGRDLFDVLEIDLQPALTHQKFLPFMNDSRYASYFRVISALFVNWWKENFIDEMSSFQFPGAFIWPKMHPGADHFLPALFVLSANRQLKPGP